MADLAIQFGTASKFGTMAGWVAQAPNISKEKSRANVLGATGDEATSKLYDEKTTCSQKYVAAASGTAPTVPATIGALMDAYVCTQMQIDTSATDLASLLLDGHNHTTSAHANTLRQAAHGISLSKSFGAVDWLGGTAGSAATLKSSSCVISCQHKDIPDGDGENCAGQNHDGRIVATVVWYGVPTTAAGAGWDVTSVVTAENNEGHLETTVRAEKALALAVPSP